MGVDEPPGEQEGKRGIKKGLMRGTEGGLPGKRRKKKLDLAGFLRAARHS